MNFLSEYNGVISPPMFPVQTPTMHAKPIIQHTYQINLLADTISLVITNVVENDRYEWKMQIAR